MTAFMLRKIPVSILCISYFLPAFAQTEKINDLENRFAGYQSHMMQEKVFIHTDKTFYMAGETIWFKAYTVDANFHKPSVTSKVLYAEITGKDQKTLLHGKIALDSGKGSGSFAIPASIPSGNYLLRAYTGWMKNFNPDFYFEQPLTIVNTLNPPVPKEIGPQGWHICSILS